MAEEKKEDRGELCHIDISVAENGYTVNCCFEAKQTLSQRAGWVPGYPGESVKYVAKTKADLIKQLEKVL